MHSNQIIKTGRLTPLKLQREEWVRHGDKRHKHLKSTDFLSFAWQKKKKWEGKQKYAISKTDLEETFNEK